MDDLGVGVAEGETQPGHGEFRIERHRLAIERDTLLHGLRAGLTRPGLGLQVGVIGPGVAGSAGQQRGLVDAQRDLQGVGDRAGDVLLDGEHVVEFAVEGAGPELKAVRRLDQLGGDAQAVAGLAHAALQHMGHPQLLADQLQVGGLALEGEA